MSVRIIDLNDQGEWGLKRAWCQKIAVFRIRNAFAERIDDSIKDLKNGAGFYWIVFL